jgi:hypothetical protein
MNQPLEPQRYTGEFVYKYRTVEHLDWLEQIVLQNLVYFPTARELNDPEEARPPLRASSLEALIAILIKSNRDASPFLTNSGLEPQAADISFNVRRRGTDSWVAALKSILDPLLTRFRIYSLSKRPDNLHLWAEYAAQHTGYCLEFRSAGFGPIWGVRYEDIALDITADSLQPYFLFYKTKKWQREEEVRMIKQQVSDACSTFDPAVLIRIILGRNIAPSNEAAIRAIAARRNQLLRVVPEPPDIRTRKRQR